MAVADTITVAVEIAKDVDVLADPASGDWTAVTTDTTEWAATLAAVNARTAPTSGGRVRIIDTARTYDPENAANTDPWTHIRVRNTYSGTTYDTFRGYTRDWPIVEGHAFNVIALDVVDAFDLFNRDVAPPLGYEYDQSGAAGWWLLDSEGVRLDGDDPARDGTWNFDPTVTSGALAATEKAYTVFDGDLFGRVKKADFAPPTAVPHVVELTVRFDVDDDTVDGDYEAFASYDGTNSIVVMVTYDATNDTVKLVAWSSLKDGSNGIETGTYPAEDWTVARHVAYRVTSGVHELWVDGVVQATESVSAPTAPTVQGTWFGGGSGTARLNWLGALANVAVFKVDVGSVVVADHADAAAGYVSDRTGRRVHRLLDGFGWPAGLRDVPDGIVACGPWDHTSKSLLAELVVLADTEVGRLFVAGDGRVTLTDRHHYTTDADTSEVTLSDDGADVAPKFGLTRTRRWSDVVNDVTVTSRPLAASVRRVDSTSRDRYGPQPPNGETYTTVAAEEELLSLAATRIDERKDPDTRVTSVRFQPLRDPANAAAEALSLVPGDRVTVQTTSQGQGSQWSQEFEVDAVEHDMNPGDWYVTLHLLAGRTATGWWTPGTSTVGTNSVWAP